MCREAEQMKGCKARTGQSQVKRRISHLTSLMLKIKTVLFPLISIKFNVLPADSLSLYQTCIKKRKDEESDFNIFPVNCCY